MNITACAFMNILMEFPPPPEFKLFFIVIIVE
jgi:hypothetical protein